MPKRLRMLLNNCTVDPNTLAEQTTWSPARKVAMQHDRIALMPLAVAMQASAPSSAARRSWKAVTVGLENRAYTLPGAWFANRAAASAALPKTKEDVRNSASECSPNGVRSVPARTAKVSMDQEWSSMVMLPECKSPVSAWR